MEKENVVYLYEAESDDYLLTKEEDSIVRAMRRLNSMWKKYKSKPGNNNLILFCGADCSIRYGTASADNAIETIEHITCDGGDGGDDF
jgi:hypothetical protein